MTSTETSEKFVIKNTLINPYPTAYGALRGGCSSRLASLLSRTDYCDQSDWRIVELREMIKRMQEEISEIQDAVNDHNENSLSAMRGG